MQIQRQFNTRDKPLLVLDQSPSPCIKVEINSLMFFSADMDLAGVGGFLFYLQYLYTIEQRESRSRSQHLTKEREL